MKILWFSSSPSNASKEFGNNHPGCGWISALETLVVKQGIHTLGICFLNNDENLKIIKKDGVTYFGIPNKKVNGLRRILNRHLSVIEDEDSSPIYDSILDDFKPDIIHVFGTENGFGKILQQKFDNVIFHLQGLAAPYYDVYFPPNIPKRKALFLDSARNMVRGLTYFHFYRIFKKRANREIEILKYWKNFSGRTSWDKNYVQTFNRKAKYYHCEELLREDFFSLKWSAPLFDKSRKIVIGTTINPNVYKGLDLIYRVLPLIDEYDIIWNIFGIQEKSSFNVIVKKILGEKMIDKIKFHGPVSSNDLLVKLNECHLFVHPSYIDNSPNSVCEAMLLGMPVIASSVGGIKTLIRNEDNGYLFNPYDKYDLAGVIVQLINNYPQAIEVGNRARETAIKRHNGNNILESLNKIYESVKNSSDLNGIS